MIATIRRRMKGWMLRRLHGMITCREFESFIASYVDGELRPRQRKVFERHLWMCRECREYLAAYRRAMEVGRAVLGSDESLPDDVPEDLVTAILDARRS